MSVAVLKDKEALKELVEFLKEDIENFLWDSINGYNHQLKRDDSILRPKGKKLPLNVQLNLVTQMRFLLRKMKMIRKKNHLNCLFKSYG